MIGMMALTNGYFPGVKIEKVCDYLQKAEAKNPNKWGSEKRNANFARELCSELLSAVDADGQGGCMLCRN